MGAIPGSRADASSPQAVSTKGFDPERELPMSMPHAPERTFTASELIRAADDDNVRLALSSAKSSFPGDVWGRGAEGEYAWLAGVAALLGTAEIVANIAEARQREKWFKERHPDDAKGITGRVPSRILKDFGLVEFLRRAASVDTHRNGGDAKQAPGDSLSGAVPKADAQ